MPRPGQDRHLLHPYHERSRKTLRHHWHHSVRQTLGLRVSRPASRQIRRARARRNLRQRRHASLRPRGEQLTCPCATSASPIARNLPDASPAAFQAAAAGQKTGTVKSLKEEGEVNSELSSEKSATHRKEYRELVTKDRRATKNLPIPLFKPFEVNRQNVAPPEKISGAAF